MYAAIKCFSISLCSQRGGESYSATAGASGGLRVKPVCESRKGPRCCRRPDGRTAQVALEEEEQEWGRGRRGAEVVSASWSSAVLST